MATAVNAVLLDRTIDHAIDFQRYSNGVIRRMVAVLNRTDARLTAQLAEALMQLDRESFTVERLDALLSSVRALNAQAYAAVFEELRPELMALAEAEADYQVGALRSTLPGVVQARFPVAGVSIDQVFAAALSRPFQGRLLRDWAKTVEDGRLVLVRNAIRQGYMEGRTTAEIIAKLRGSRALNFKDGLLDRSRRELATVVQTALSHTAQTARQAFYDANTDVIKALKWTATLDSRTSPMCRARDGKLYDPETHRPLGHHIPWLGGPGRLHFNCRSVSSPVTKSWEELGIPASEMPSGTRASMDGQVPEDMTYAQWFAKQSAARQDEIVGPVRGKLYRAGKLSFDAFTDDKGRWLTLPQLRERGA